jgi:hypothetical protein
MSDGKYGYINNLGEFIISPQFDEADLFTDHGIARVKFDNRYGYINLQGRYVINPLYHYAQPYSSGGLLMIIDASGGYGFINSKGETIVRPRYDKALVFGQYNLAPVMQNNLFGYIDSTGSFTISAQFDLAFPFVNDLAIIAVNDRYGYIDNQGKIIINPRFLEASFFSVDGYAYVRNSTGKVGLIDRTGNYEFSAQFDNYQLPFRWLGQSYDDYLTSLFLTLIQ